MTVVGARCSDTGACPSSTCRPPPRSPWSILRAAMPSCSMARSTTTSNCAGSWRTVGTAFTRRVTPRSCCAPYRVKRNRRHPGTEGHVRLRVLAGRQSQSLACARPAGHQAALHRSQSGPIWRPRVRQLITQASDFIRCCFTQCHYSKVSCSGRLGFARFKAAKTWVCSLLVVDSPALGWVPFRVMR